MDLSELLSAFWRERFVLLTSIILALIIGLYYLLFVAESRYTAVARLVMEARNQQIVDVESVLSGTSKDEAALNTELEIIRSRSQLETLIADMDLLQDPEFNGTLREPGLLDGVKAKIAQQLGREPKPLTADQILYATTRAVSNAVVAEGQRNTLIMEVRVTTSDPEKSAEMANRLARIYLDDQVSIKFQATEYAVDWLTEKVSELETELFEKENAIKDLKAATSLISIDNLEALGIRAKDLRTRLTENKMELTDARARLIQAQTAARGEPRQVAEFFGDPILTRVLPPKLGGDGATFDARVEALLSGQQDDVRRLETQVATLQTAYDEISEEISTQSSDLDRLQQLEREAEATRVLYETFLTRLKETSVQIGLLQADSRILSDAIPGFKVAPRKSTILAGFLFLGLLVGSGIAINRQFRANGFRSTTELENIVGVYVLGQIPRMPIRKRNELVEYLENKPLSAAVEATRNLRTSILGLDPNNPPQVIMSTSSVPGEGKTTQAISLSQNLAKMGKRVLLMDCDIRRQTLTRYFPQAKDSGSLGAVLSGEIEIGAAIAHDPKTGIDILFENEATGKQADVFHGLAFRELIAQLRTMYDFVVIDSPPVLIVPDSRIIGHHVDAILYSVKWDDTPQSLVIEGLRQMRMSGLNVSGLVLSQIDMGSLKRYGYGELYGTYEGKYAKGYYHQ